MANKEEILNEIKKTEEHLANMKKMLAECEYERWKPEKGKGYYFLNSCNTVRCKTWDADCSDVAHYNIYNCFKTREQAEAEAENVLVRRMLEDIARRLNKGKEFDWSDEDQTKSFIFLDCKTQLIERDGNLRNKIQGVVYCLDNNFRKITIQEIGEERLKKYLRGE